MTLLILTLTLLSLTLCQLTPNCTTPPISLKLVSHPNFVLYYSVNKDCTQLLVIDYCELQTCKLQIRDVCYWFEVTFQHNETVCKQKCCQGVSKIDLQLFDGLGCSSVDIMGKNATQKTNSSKGEMESNKKSEYSNSIQNETNNNSTIIDVQQNKNFQFVLFVFCWSLLLFMAFLVCCCKCYTSLQQDSQIIIPEVQINTQRVLNPIKSKPQELKQKSWSLPLKKQTYKDAKLSEQQCTICLSGQPNCTLECDHGFHKDCIVQWLQRVFSCPLCKSNKISTLTIRCNRCLIYRYSCSLGQLKPSFATEDICSSCANYTN